MLSFTVREPRYKYAPPDEKRAAVLGELWGQSKIPWGHCWHGDKAAQEDPRGGFTSEQQFIEVRRIRLL